MPTEFKIIPSPRPEPGKEPPLPTYHELLNILCDEFSVPGSHDFRGAIRYIKGHYQTMAQTVTQRFLNWSVLEGHGASPTAMSLIESYSVTPEGRQRIAEAYVVPAQQRLQRALRGSVEARRLALIIETLISIFPEEERFCPPLITLREVLIDLYGFLSPNYELVPESMTDGEITYERIQQVAAWQQQEVLRQPSAHSSRIIRALRDVGVRVQAVFTSESGVVIEVPLDVPVSLVEGVPIGM